MKTFGICMEAVEPYIRKWLVDVASRSTKINYLEIGLASGYTLDGVCELLESTPGLDWHAYGIDYGEGWPEASLDTLRAKFSVYGDRVNLSFGGSHNDLLSWDTPLNFVLIDGCHERECCKKDFLLVEPHVVDGGVVAFHDSGTTEQGGGIQPHNGQPIAVRSAIDDLGLLNGSRPGWLTLDDVCPVNNSGCFLTRKAHSRQG